MDCVTLSEDRQQQIDELEKQLKRGKSEISLLRKSMNKYIEGIDETAQLATKS
jgi:molecular chaperone GrpE (heat shock protein)